MKKLVVESYFSKIFEQNTLIGNLVWFWSVSNNNAAKQNVQT